MLCQRLSVSEIAQQRGLAETTIIGQMERLADQGVSLELDHVMPSAERVRKIREAFDVCGEVYLKPAWEFLGAEFAYNELRLVRMYLRQQGQLADSRNA